MRRALSVRSQRSRILQSSTELMRVQFLWVILAIATTQLAAADAEKRARRAASGKAAAKQQSPRPANGLAFEQILTEEQRQTLREYTQTQAESLRQNRQEAIKLRRELQDAVLSGKADEAAIRQKSEAIAKLEAEALTARMAAVAKVAADLTPEQKEKIKELGRSSRRARPGLGGDGRDGNALLPPREPAAPPPPDK